jgi:hypothetical protein
MSSDDLTKAQAKAISEALFPGLNYLFRLERRMEKTGFTPEDKLYQLVRAAYDAAQPANLWDMRMMSASIVHQAD